MGVDEHAQHAEGFVVFDEAHAAHVGGELEDGGDAFGGAVAGVLVLEVEDEILDAVSDLIPVVERLLVDAADDLDPIGKEVLDQMATDEAARAADGHFLTLEIHSEAPMHFGQTILAALITVQAGTKHQREKCRTHRN